MTNYVGRIDQIDLAESTKKLAEVTMLGEVEVGRNGGWPK